VSNAYDPADDPVVSIAKALHRLAAAVESIDAHLETGAVLVTVNLEPSDCEALRVKLERDE